jgi:hypothetical protein
MDAGELGLINSTVMLSENKTDLPVWVSRFYFTKIV